MAEYKLSYTASDINNKLGQIEKIEQRLDNLSIGGDDYITLNLTLDDSKVAFSDFQMPMIADKTVEQVLAEVNEGKKRMKIYMEGNDEPIIMNLSATYPILSFSLLVGGEEIGE